MAKNDSILIDGIVSQRAADRKPSDDKGEVFEYFGFEQILKEYDLSEEELEAGSVDGRHDGGIDGFFILVNGHLITETTVTWPKSHAQVDVIVISCKHHDTFREAPLNSMLATVQELFDLSIDSADLKGTYSTASVAMAKRVADELDVGVVLVRGPMVLKIVWGKGTSIGSRSTSAI